MNYEFNSPPSSQCVSGCTIYHIEILDFPFSIHRSYLDKVSFIFIVDAN